MLPGHLVNLPDQRTVAGRLVQNQVVLVFDCASLDIFVFVSTVDQHVLGVSVEVLVDVDVVAFWPPYLVEVVHVKLSKSGLLPAG